MIDLFFSIIWGRLVKVLGNITYVKSVTIWNGIYSTYYFLAFSVILQWLRSNLFTYVFSSKDVVSSETSCMFRLNKKIVVNKHKQQSNIKKVIKVYPIFDFDNSRLVIDGSLAFTFERRRRSSSMWITQKSWE